MKDDQSNSWDADINSEENGLNLQGFEKKSLVAGECKRSENRNMHCVLQKKLLMHSSLP